MAGGARHEARRLAAQALYALDMNPAISPEESLARARSECADGVADLEFAEQVVRGAWERHHELDETIGRASRHWKVSRMGRVDRSILRLSTYELLHRPETPVPVILDEGIELAKEFGSPDAPAFVNGLLDRIAREYRQSEVGRKED